MVVGRLVELGCDALRTRLGLDNAVTGDAVRAAIRRWYERHPGEDPIGEAVYERPPGVAWDDATYRGDAYATFGWGAYVAEVEVDLRTYETRVTDFVALQEVGHVLNDGLARGQVQGGVAQAVGWALLEECRWQNGAMANGQLTNYIIPTSDDLPPIRVAFIENPYPFGAQGAKGLGELPMDGPAPAILNAVAAATGADPCTIPLTPERLMAMAP
jgi:CO/xanthine dehydrogenase Mo-binding subunit